MGDSDGVPAVAKKHSPAVLMGMVFASVLGIAGGGFVGTNLGGSGVAERLAVVEEKIRTVEKTTERIEKAVEKLQK